MTTFKIKYKDPTSDALITEEKEFSDTDTISAKEWAEDYAYSKADKGWYKVEEAWQ